VDRFKLITSSYLIFIKDEKVLLMRRFNTGYEDGKYSLPAGHKEAGESITKCMQREAKEEIGIDLKLEDLKVVHVMHRKADDERMDFFFTSLETTQEPVNKEPEKCDDLAWFPLNSLPENIIPYIKTAIENSQKEIFFSEFGW